MINWNSIKEEQPKAYGALLEWFSTQHPDCIVTGETVDPDGHKSDFYLKVVVSKKPNSMKSKIKSARTESVLVKEMFFQIRELFDFFDDQQVDIDIQPQYREMLGMREARRMYRIEIFMEGNKLYPATAEVMGGEYASRRDAEIVAFGKGFRILESQLSLSGGSGY